MHNNSNIINNIIYKYETYLYYKDINILFIKLHMFICDIYIYKFKISKGFLWNLDIVLWYHKYIYL